MSGKLLSDLAAASYYSRILWSGGSQMRRAFILILILVVSGLAAATFGHDVVRLTDTTGSVDRSPWASSGLAGFAGQNSQRADSAIAPANPRSGRYACVATFR